MTLDLLPGPMLFFLFLIVAMASPELSPKLGGIEPWGRGPSSGSMGLGRPESEKPAGSTP